jgi:hypothetical protein
LYYIYILSDISKKHFPLLEAALVKKNCRRVFVGILYGAFSAYRGGHNRRDGLSAMSEDFDDSTGFLVASGIKPPAEKRSRRL